MMCDFHMSDTPYLQSFQKYTSWVYHDMRIQRYENKINKNIL